MCLHLKKLKNLWICVDYVEDRLVFENIDINDDFYKKKYQKMFVRFKNENKLNVTIGNLETFEEFETLTIICSYFGNTVTIGNDTIDNKSFWNDKNEFGLQKPKRYKVFDWGP